MATIKSLVELLRSSSSTISRGELLQALKYSTRADIGNALALATSNSDTATAAPSAPTPAAATAAAAATITSTSSSASLVNVPAQMTNSISSEAGKSETAGNDVENKTFVLDEDDNDDEAQADEVEAQQNVADSGSGTEPNVNLHSAENFDEHISANCGVEFDDNTSGKKPTKKKIKTTFMCESEKVFLKLSVFLFREPLVPEADK